MPAPRRSQTITEGDLYAEIIGDRPGWQRLAFDEFHKLVRGLLIKTLGPHAEIDDLVGEVFVGFFESARNIRSAEGMRSYMVSIIMNTARREIRRRKRRRLLFWKDEPADSIERVPSTDDPKAKAALLQLSRILEGLGVEERLAYVLHELDGLGLIEVAAALGVSHSTAKRRVRRASEFVRRRVVRNALLTDYVREKAGDDS